MIQLFAVKDQIKVDWPPGSSSVALSLAIIRETMDRRSEVALNGRVLSQQLSKAVKDAYVRTSSKDARYKPNQKTSPPPPGPSLPKPTCNKNNDSTPSIISLHFFLNGVGHALFQFRRVNGAIADERSKMVNGFARNAFGWWLLIEQNVSRLRLRPLQIMTGISAFMPRIFS